MPAAATASSSNNKTTIVALKNISTFADETSGAFSKSYKLELRVSGAKQVVQLRFHQNGSRSIKSWQAAMADALKGQGWLEYERLEAQRKGKISLLEQRPEGASSSTAGARRVMGISGLQQRRKNKQQEQATLAAAACTSIDALKKEAKKMVQMIERFAADKKFKESSKEDREQFGSLVYDVGISNPVTRETAGSGSVFLSDLARELAAFLRDPLAEAGGMLLLTDIYALYNRARGSALVAPDELHTACSMLGKHRLGMALRVWPSGVKVVQLDSHTDEAVVARLTKLVAAKGSLSSIEVAEAWEISLSVAAEYLQLAEAAPFHALCRDDTLEGLYFFPNAFLNPAGAAPALPAAAKAST